MTNTSGKAKELKKVKSEAELEVERLKKQLAQKEKELNAYQEIEEQQKSGHRDIDENDKVSPDDYIEIISMSPTLLTLTTEPKGRGNHYSWVQYKDTRQIVYSDWQRILTNHGSGLYTDFIRKGYVYINNPAAVKKSGLQEVYKKLLPPDKMDEVLECNRTTSLDLFNSAPKDQQLNICKLMIDRMAKGAPYDLNVIDQISRASGVEIQKLSEEAKSYLDMNLKTTIE